jgi:hypothetical protein
MQERKNKRLAILFCALCCMTAIVFYLGKTDGAVAVSRSMFKDFDFKSIDQVVLESKKGRVDLKFNGTKWKVNNQFDADQSMVEVLFATLQQAEPKRPLATDIQDSIITGLKQQGVKVSVVSAGQSALTFYAGGNAQKTQAYFATIDDDPKSYLVTIPGYRVYASGIFEVPEKDWKNKYVFGFNWRNFQRLEAEFPGQRENNFEVVPNDNYFSVAGIISVDTAKLNTFLDDISLLTVDNYLEEAAEDSIPQSSPIMVLKVKDIGQRVYTLQLFQPKLSGDAIPGLINGIQWALFHPAKIRRIQKSKAFFEK